MNNKSTRAERGTSMNNRIDELTADELQKINGGDGWEWVAGAVYGVALLGGVFAAPVFLGVALAGGAVLVAWEP